MRKKGIDIEIDLLTNSTENSETCEVFDTKVVRLEKSGKMNIQPAEWLFDCEGVLEVPNWELNGHPMWFGVVFAGGYNLAGNFPVHNV